MRAIAQTALALLGVAVIVVVAAVGAGVTLGLFFGALLWTAQAVAGSLAPETADISPWWVLAVLALVLTSEAIVGRRHERRGPRRARCGGAGGEGRSA